MKKLLTAILTLTISLGVVCPNVYAMENGIDIQGTQEEYYDELGNYDNPETGEYLHWNTNTRSGTRTFSFQIRYTLPSSSFKLGGTSVKINMNKVSFQYASGSVASCCNNHQFTVNLRRDGLSNNKALFTAPFAAATSGLGSGFSTSSNYLVEITNNDVLPDGIYLVGSGSVYSY